MSFMDAQLGVVQRLKAAEGIEDAYLDLLDKLLKLAEQPSIERDELLKLLTYNPTTAPTPPKCNCGHEFSNDPSWYHLDPCAFRAFYA